MIIDILLIIVTLVGMLCILYDWIRIAQQYISGKTIKTIKEIIFDFIEIVPEVLGMPFLFMFFLAGILRILIALNVIAIVR